MSASSGDGTAADTFDPSEDGFDATINQHLDDDAVCTECHHTGFAHDEDGCHHCMDYCIFNTGVPDTPTA